MSSVRYIFSCLAIAILFALCAMPGSALAHAGHSHGTPVAIDASSASADEHATITASFTEQDVIAFVAPLPAPSDDRGCVGGCCFMTGMACCSVALMPSPMDEPAIGRSTVFVIVDYRPSYGLTPEALPKPPKFLA
jgi:hypothetical protein